MATAFDTYVKINGKRFNLTSPDAVKRLLISRRGRRIIAGWLNTHKRGPEYQTVYSIVSNLTGGDVKILEPLAAAATITACMLNPAMSFPQSVRPGYSAVCKVCHVSDEVAKRYLNNTPDKQTTAVAKAAGSQKYPVKANFLKDLKKLSFASLKTKGPGVSKVGDVFEIDDSASGKVQATELVFRDEKGIRIKSEIGECATKGMEIVFGNRAYRMLRDGVEWDMRNVISVNGIPADGSVFVAEYFVKKHSGDINVLEAKNKKSLIKEIQDRYPAETERPPEDKQIKEASVDAREDRLAAVKEKEKSLQSAMREEKDIKEMAAISPVESKPAAEKEDSTQVKQPETTERQENKPDIKPEYAFYQLKEPEKPADKEIKEITDTLTGNWISVTEKEGYLEVTQSSGGLTLQHVFKGNSGLTVHKVFLKAYPKISFTEVFDVPLAEVKSNILKHIRGVDGRLEANILILVNAELGSMFDNTARQLPSPDGRIVTGVKILGRNDYSKYIYINLLGGYDTGRGADSSIERWVALDDNFLVKLMQSQPAPSTQITDKK